MRIRLEEARHEPLRWSETVEVPVESLEREELASLSPVLWEGRMAYADPGFHFRARAEYRQTLRCARCLTEYVEPVAAELELLVLEQDEPEEEEQELEEADLGVLYVDGPVLDTRPLLVEQIQLNVPMRPLCSEDCRGLCPQCGADLATGGCDCKDESVDSRWAALAALRDRLPET